jgi:hypothetical protein
MLNRQVKLREAKEMYSTWFIITFEASLKFIEVVFKKVVSGNSHLCLGVVETSLCTLVLRHQAFKCNILQRERDINTKANAFILHILVSLLSMSWAMLT